MEDLDQHDPFSDYSSKQLATWTLRLACSPILRGLLQGDPHVFALMYASCSAAITPPDSVTNGVEIKTSVAGREFMEVLKDLQSQFGSEISGRFARLYVEGLQVYEKISANDDSSYADEATPPMQEWLEKALNETATLRTSTEENIERLGVVLELTPADQAILLWQVNRRQPGFGQLIEQVMSQQNSAMSYATYMIIADMLGLELRDVMQSLESPKSPLRRAGIVDIQSSPFRLLPPSNHLRGVLSSPADTDKAFFDRFVKEMTVKSSTATMARFDDRDKTILTQLAALDMPEDGQGVHVLIYGPESLDKRELVARTMRDKEIPVFEVQTREVPSSEMPAWAHVAQLHVQREQGENAVLLIENAEAVLTARRNVSLMSIFGMVEDEIDDERESDETLISNGRCIWLTNRARSLSERNIGRFVFMCEARPGSRADRRNRIEQVTSELQLPAELSAELAKYSLLGEQQIRQATRLAELLAEDAGDGADQPATEDEQNIIRRAVFQSQRALGREHTEKLRDSITHYDLANLNLSGKFQADVIIKALKKRPRGSLCFYGMPGAGKTQLAEFIAVQLDMPIIMRSAAELLSKWVGENEQNLAAMFAEAESEGAILFLDEADSFLRDRSKARAEWSVTQVNEILQQMERFPGVFIAATNLMDDIDAAALRRFTWKLDFQALKPEQKWHMFVVETELDLAAIDEEEMRPRVEAIANLTPGDFATVKRQCEMLDEKLDPEQWIEQLSLEAKAKLKGLVRNNLGFAAES